MATIDEEIARVKKAIEAIESGAQSYEIDGMKINRATLFRLYDRLRELENQKALQQNTNPIGLFVRFVRK